MQGLVRVFCAAALRIGPLVDLAELLSGPAVSNMSLLTHWSLAWPLRTLGRTRKARCARAALV
jgi:hypothetical protein